MEAEMDAFRKELRRLRNDLRDARQPLDALQKVQQDADALDALAKQPVQNAIQLPERDDDGWRARLGDAVWLEVLKAEGTVVEIEREDAVVQVGKLKVRAKVGDLLKPNRATKEKTKKKHVSVYADYEPDIDVPAPQSPGMELDLRGMRVDDALSRLDSYIDTAYLARLPFARVIHGKGTGALRRAVGERLKEHPLISKSIIAPPKEGGEGVTIIYLVPPA
jgi:DNA mismatch repair protein MutS2